MMLAADFILSMPLSGNSQARQRTRGDRKGNRKATGIQSVDGANAASTGSRLSPNSDFKSRQRSADLKLTTTPDVPEPLALDLTALPGLAFLHLFQPFPMGRAGAHYLKGAPMVPYEVGH